MKRIKLSALTNESLRRNGINPVDEKSIAEQILNESYPDIPLLGCYTIPHGKVVREIDPALFRECVNDTANWMIKSRYWIQIDGDYYSLAEVISTYEARDYTVVDDLS